ncbi:DnaB-like helicase N-terminal domain-containing protein [Streptomyces sp. NPDC046977]|uniref:DnaB-like helicase N-terminal domain-containing protein n=1 Tax=Streptomyces sp. NPDC046977 TaxID=3154703 RepID=UPI0033EF8148
MSKTLVGTPDPDPPPPALLLSDERAEQVTLAALLRQPGLAPYLLVALHATDYSSPAHREVFLAATAVFYRKEPCTPAAVAAEVARRQQASTVPSREAAKALMVDGLARAAVPAEPVVAHYAAIVRDLAALRRHLATASSEDLPPVPMRGFLLDEDDT